MSSPWRIRDWALSLLACGFTLDVNPTAFCSSSNRSTERTEVSERVARTRNISNPKREFPDDDYIVFCFRKDGKFDVVRSRPSNFTNISEIRPRRPGVDRKMRVGEEHENKDHYPTIHENPTFSDDEEEKTIYIDSEDSRRGEDIENADRELSRKSSGGSNRSDDSASSFAFPILRWEWEGSPAQMPRTAEKLPLRKHKACCVGFHHCCNF